MFSNRQCEMAADSPVATLARLTVVDAAAGDSPAPRRMVEEVGPKPMPKAPSTSEATNPASSDQDQVPHDRPPR